MCGIAGYVTGTDPRPVAAFEAAVLQTLAHRGRDDLGWLTDRRPARRYPGRPRPVGPAPPAAGDPRPLRPGHQPMLTPDGRYAIVFNGEIYNYRRAARRIGEAGPRFRSQIRHRGPAAGLRALGPGVPDAAHRHVRLRDQRPRAPADVPRPRLLRHQAALLCPHPAAGSRSPRRSRPCGRLVSGTVRPQRLYDYLRDGRTDHGGDTLLERRSPVPAAHCMEVARHRRASEPRALLGHRPEPPDRRFVRRGGPVRALFLDSVRLHLRSDVPVGAALSGGIDSSAIVAGMRAVEPRAELHTFSFIADDPPSARSTGSTWRPARRGAVHKVRTAPDELVADLDQLVRRAGRAVRQHQHLRPVSRVPAGPRARHQGDAGRPGQGRNARRLSPLPAGPPRLARARARPDEASVRSPRGAAARRGAADRALGLGSAGCRRVGCRRRRRLAGKPRRAAWLDGAGSATGGGVPDGRAAARDADELRERLHREPDDDQPADAAALRRPQLDGAVDRDRVPFLTHGAGRLRPVPAGGVPDLRRMARPRPCSARRCAASCPDAILDRRDKIGFATPGKEMAPGTRPRGSAGTGRARSDWRGCTRRPSAASGEPSWPGRSRSHWRVWRWVNLFLSPWGGGVGNVPSS